MITLTLTLNRLGGIKCLAFVLFVRLYACFSNSVLFKISLKRALQKTSIVYHYFAMFGASCAF